MQPPPEVAQTPPPAPPNALTLERAIQLALEGNYDLRRTQYQSLTAEQNLVLARSIILPRLDFNGSVQKVRQGAGQQVVGGVPFDVPAKLSYQYNGNLVVRQLVFDGGNWWNNLAAASLALQSSQATVAEQRLTTIYTVEQRFYELIRQQRQLKVLGDAAQRSRDQADFTQRLFEGGRVTQADVYAARANRDNDEIWARRRASSWRGRISLSPSALRPPSLSRSSNRVRCDRTPRRRRPRARRWTRRFRNGPASRRSR